MKTHSEQGERKKDRERKIEKERLRKRDRERETKKERVRKRV